MQRKNPDFNNFFHFNPIPTWVIDLNTFKILDGNQAALAEYNYTKEEISGLTLIDIHSKMDLFELMEIYRDFKKQEGNIYFGVFDHKKKKQ